jgi:hypothetical protein
MNSGDERGRADPKTAERDHRERALDEALSESFPASDPPAMLRRPRRTRNGEAEQAT